jgi:ABC-type polysaccharide/polyol phosphate transport system ATPase subunit
VTSAIELSGVSKSYVKYDDEPMMLSGLRLTSRTRRSRLDAVRDLDLSVAQGSSLGVLGRNGAGKSTLLQMLCGVTAPSQGRVAVSGRVAPLISVGVGFHPELTGRENVYVNGTVLGMTRAEIDRRFDAVVDFAEIEEFIDTPVKFYSSGMFVRLGFSVAVAADPDVLLVDEVLAVGDFAFQMKCYRRMDEIRAQGSTIVIVSHNINAIRNLCDSAIVLQTGRKVFEGGTHEAISAYYRTVGQVPDSEIDQADQADQVGSSPSLEIESVDLLRADGSLTANLTAGEEATVRATVTATRPLDGIVMGVSMATERGIPAYTESNLNRPFAAMAAGERAQLELRFTANLASGGYLLTSSLHHARPDGGVERLGGGEPLSFFVSGRPLVHGVADLEGRFSSRPPTT